MNMLLRLRFNFFDNTVINSSSLVESAAKRHNMTPVAVIPNITYKTGVPYKNPPVILLA